MRGFTGPGIVIMLAVSACSSTNDGSSTAAGPELAEVNQTAAGSCGFTNVCIAHEVCGAWDLDVPGDGLGYTVSPPTVELGPSYTFTSLRDGHAAYRALSRDPCPAAATARRDALIAARPDMSPQARAGLAVSLEEQLVDRRVTTTGCGRDDQFCEIRYDDSYQCYFHISDYPSAKSSGLHDCPACTQYEPVVCRANHAVVAGAAHTCALVNGGLQCWGSNSHGQLGDGSTVATNFNRVPVTGLASGVYTVSAGTIHTCAIVGGEAKCWGFNGNGQLGNPVVGNSHVPVPVSNLSGVQAIAPGDLHTCAIAGDGAWCWGYNGSGQLGVSPATTESNVPIQVTGLTSGVQDISTGALHSCAIVNGAALCWGDNRSGQLGNGTVGGPPPPPQSNLPVPVTGLTSGVQAISAGLTHTCALVSGGVQCWGNNDNGQLGNGTPGGPPPPELSYVPIQVPGLSSGVLSLTAGRNHTCALLTDGSMQCWGYNAFGQLGTGSFEPRSSAFPVAVTDLASGVQAIATGYNHNCAIGTGGLQCWGANFSGQLAVDSDTFFMRASPLLIGQLTCALVDGSMKCTEP